MNPASKDICDMLEAESSLGLVFATNLFIGKEPAEPDDCTTIFDTPGLPPVLTFAGKDDLGYYFPSVQIRVRSNSYMTGWNLIDSIKTYLHGIKGEVWSSAEYDVIKCGNEPFLLDWDENKRVRFVATFNISRKETN